MRAIHFYVRGRVQGVWFRDSTQREALRLGLAGWVRNLRDGRVEGRAEGDNAAMDEIIEFLRQGPPRALVVQLEVQEVEIADLNGFEIR